MGLEAAVTFAGDLITITGLSVAFLMKSKTNFQKDKRSPLVYTFVSLPGVVSSFLCLH